MLAEQVRRSLRAPINIAGQEIVLTASIGIALYDGPDEDPAELLREAEIAMYRAKRAGPTASRSSTPRCAPRRTSASALESDLRRAIEKRQLQARLPADLLSADGDAGGLRGAGALGASQARHAQPGRVRARRRGDRPDRQARLLRAGARRARGRALAEGAAATGRAAVRRASMSRAGSCSGRSWSARCAISSAAP